MPRGTWVPEDRVQWLLDRYPAYLKTQRSTRSAYMSNLFKDYIARWPHPEPTPEFLEEFRMKPNPVKNPKQRTAASTSSQGHANDPPNIEADMVRCTDEEMRERALAQLDHLLLKVSLTCHFYLDNTYPVTTQRLKEWFRNHGRVTSNKAKDVVSNTPVASTGSSKILPLGAKKASQSWQAYFSKYRSQLQPLIDQDWQAYRDSLPVTEKPHFLSFFQKWCKDRLAKEDDSVKNEVEEYRQSYNEYEDPAETHDEKMLRMQQAQNKLVRTLNSAGDAILMQTGWSSLIMAGGPEIKAGGEPKIYVSCAGEVDGKMFADWLGDARYTQLQRWFADFLAEKYRDSINSGLWSVMPNDSGSVTRPSTERDNSDHSDSNNSDSDSDSDEDNDAAPSKNLANYLAPVEEREAYAREKAACTAATQALLAEMRKEWQEGLAAGGMRPPIFSDKAAQDGNTQPKIRKPKSNKKNTNSAKRQSTRLSAKKTDVEAEGTSTVNDSSALSISLSVKNDEANPPQDNLSATSASPMAVANTEGRRDSETEDNNNHNDQVPRSSVENLQSVSELNVSTSPPSSDVVPAEKATPLDAKENHHSQIENDGNDASPVLLPGTTTSDNSMDLVNHNTPPIRQLPAPQVVDNMMHISTTTIPNVATPPSVTITESPGDDVAHINPTIVHNEGHTTAGLEPVIITPQSTTTMKRSSDDVALTNIPNDRPSELESHQSDSLATNEVEMNVDQMSSSTNNIDVSSLQPPHQDMKGVWPVLISASTDLRWIGCLKAFVNFEISKPPHGKLNVRGRPSEVTTWIKDKKKHIVPKLTALKFGKEWIQWWHNLQPPSRRDGDGIPQLRQNVPSEEWSKTLLKGGTAGIYTVVVALAWWVMSYPEEPDLWSCVDDTKWVLCQLLATHASKKRAADDDAEIVVSKRQ
ncbi:hypothetical protein CVT24_001010 [Panaeolus cyanescens]|uniref:Uncharacterized protein n=1 Tax=Panaeolus cyanescens TaxID=181874 RepID=A0A409YY46_9AGAR|nr:hypothetical protein CVT24_001010 [Panaeolus cyanescens]